MDDVLINAFAKELLDTVDKKMRQSAYKDIGEKKYYEEHVDSYQAEREALFKEIE